MTFDQKREMLTEIDEDILLADWFENVLIGYAEIFNKTIAMYDRDKCIKILIKRDKMTFEEAEEFFDFNVTGSYMGEYTPAFVTLFSKQG